MEDPFNQQTDNEQVDDALPRRPVRIVRRPAPSVLEDALTRLAQTVERMTNIQNRPQANPAALNAPKDPDFNWAALRSPLDVLFPLPATGVVQRIAASLFAKVQGNALTGRNQREARFVLDMMADWEDI